MDPSKKAVNGGATSAETPAKEKVPRVLKTFHSEDAVVSSVEDLARLHLPNAQLTVVNPNSNTAAKKSAPGAVARLNVQPLQGAAGDMRPLSPTPLFEPKELENVLIPMKDGVHLAARIWLPVAQPHQKFPAIFEFIPYGKRHGTTYRDEINYRYIAQFGFGCVRVDCRGYGESEGIMEDEYLPLEQADAMECIEWISKQDWCSGNVGMTGISWGGFNSLQVASHQPTQLKGILALCCSENRYMTDVHYAGGCLLNDNISWASFMLTLNGCAPDPALVGQDRWREMWMKRLDKNSLWLKTWMQHQWYDAYWKQGSVCENFKSIQCPVLAASGWADGYCNAVPTLVEHIRPEDGSLVRGINGPWSHNLPHMGFPGPRVDWLSETIKWWTYCLKGDKEMEEVWKATPQYSAFMGEYQEPSIIVEKRSGRWVSEEQWPSKSIVMTPFYMTHTRALVPDLESVKARTYDKFKSPLSTGLDCGRQGYGKDPDFPIDQRHEDANSLCFDSKILDERVEILGSVQIRLNVACTTETGSVVVRLCDFDPQNKSSSLVSYGILNLTHMDSHESPKPLIPGKMYRNVQVSLNQTAHAFPVGHRIRIAVSTSMWPTIWPSPKGAAISLATVFDEQMETLQEDMISRAYLPIRPVPDVTENLVEDQPNNTGLYRDPKFAKAAPTTELRPSKLGTRQLMNDYVSGEKKLILSKDYGLIRDDTNGIEHDEWTEETYFIKDPKHRNEEPDPLSARTEVKYYIEVGRSKEWIDKLIQQGRYKSITASNKPTEDWRFRIETRTLFHSTETHFHIEAELFAYEFHGQGDARQKKEVFRRAWKEEIERKLV